MSEDDTLDDLAAAAKQARVVPNYRARSAPQPAYRPVVIERTSKFWKGQMLLAALLAIVGAGLVTMAFKAGVDSNLPVIGDLQNQFNVGSLMAAGGILWFIFARIGAWWNHG